MVELREHQQQAIDRLRELNNQGGVLIGMGGGKTRIALQIARQYERVLVVLPLSVSSVWEREARIVAYPYPVVDLTSGPIKARSQRLRRVKYGIVLVNYEVFWREPLRTTIEHFKPQCVILDEAHRIRHRGSRQARFAVLLGKRDYIQARLALTGTPITNGIQDAWSIYKFVSPDLFGTYPEFASRYLIPGFFPNQIRGYQNEDEAKQLIASRSFQWDGQSSSSQQDVEIAVELSKHTRHVYTELKKNAIVEVENQQGEETLVVVRIILTMRLRLQQITGGFVRNTGEAIVELSTEKATIACDLISDAVAQKEQVVVFARFLHDLDVVQRMLPKSIRVARIDGSRASQQRKAALTAFDKGQVDVMLCQLKAASLGIDLSRAKVCIFFSVGFSLDEYLQARGRLLGALRQRHAVTFYHLLAKQTIDEQIYKALAQKTAIARRVTDLAYALSLFNGE